MATNNNSQQDRSGKGTGAYKLTWVTDNLAVGGAPMSYEALETLRQAKICCVMNLCAEFCDLHWIEAGEGFETYYLPIPDEEAPDLEELEKALDWLDEALYLGKKTLIHCRHGIGRTGTVLNAYLLRKGLGHKLANQHLKPLRSKPQNFYQWRFVRRFGKKEGRLTIREPSLEARHLVDLYPFFADYETLVDEVEEFVQDRLKAQGGDKAPRCGRDNMACCHNLNLMTLAEAVYVSHAINTTLAQPERLAAMAKAADNSKILRKLGFAPEVGAASPGLRKNYREHHRLCAMSELGECRIFDQRPLSCRISDLPEDDRRRKLLTSHRPAELKRISQAIYLAYVSELPGDLDMRFALPDVISGKFVQAFFHMLTKTGA